MWLCLAFLSALFAGVTAVLAKCGIRNVPSDLATALRTVVVLFFSWVMVFVVGSQNTIGEIPAKAAAFLVLSGLSTGASWLCYFHALQLGDVNKVTPVDKSSTIITMLLAMLFLGETPTWLTLVAMVLIAVGTYLMIERRSTSQQTTGKSWFLYAFGSALFAALTAIFGKVGMTEVESNLGTALRTVVVLVLAWAIVFARGQQKGIPSIDGKSWLFLILSGFTTGASWLCYYGALHDEASRASVVVPIDKLSILVTILFSRVFLKERLSKKAFAGLVLLVGGTLLLLV